MNIFVGNLSFSAKEEDVYKVFSGFGAVANVAIVMEKKGRKSRGFGFVEMPDEQEALSAISALQGKEILGRPVNVMVSLPKKPRGERIDKIEKDQPQAKVDIRQGNFLKRTGRYKQGRRSINYLKKRVAVGITAPVHERKYKANPMRWRKKPRWAVSSRKPQGGLKPWEKTESGQSKPGEKVESGAKHWRKGSNTLRQGHPRIKSLARHKK
ncbi:MAG: RNA-binding protein [Candidatus Omnitrophica bacterium]|nr:RNA-binding protein [Candidatus Omnitrophota bacterium]